MISTLPIDREVEETYPQIITFGCTEAQALTLGYSSLDAMAVAISGASIQLQTSVANVDGSIVASIGGADATVRVIFELPVSITDAVQILSYRVVFEPGSATSERVLCQGAITINARPTA